MTSARMVGALSALAVTWASAVVVRASSPPDARTGAPIDVSDVAFIAFAPQDHTSGRLAVATFVAAR